MYLVHAHWWDTSIACVQPFLEAAWGHHSTANLQTPFDSVSLVPNVGRLTPRSHAVNHDFPVSDGKAWAEKVRVGRLFKGLWTWPWEA